MQIFITQITFLLWIIGAMELCCRLNLLVSVLLFEVDFLMQKDCAPVVCFISGCYSLSNQGSLRHNYLFSRKEEGWAKWRNNDIIAMYVHTTFTTPTAQQHAWFMVSGSSISSSSAWCIHLHHCSWGVAYIVAVHTFEDLYHKLASTMYGHTNACRFVISYTCSYTVMQNVWFGY